MPTLNWRTAKQCVSGFCGIDEKGGMLQNGQLPRNMQAKKSLRSALQEFNILN